MSTIKLTLEIVFTEVEDQQMPSIERICDKASEEIYDLVIDKTAIVQSFHITRINGEPAE